MKAKSASAPAGTCRGHGHGHGRANPPPTNATVPPVTAAAAAAKKASAEREVEEREAIRVAEASAAATKTVGKMIASESMPPPSNVQVPTQSSLAIAKLDNKLGDYWNALEEKNKSGKHPIHRSSRREAEADNPSAGVVEAEAEAEHNNSCPTPRYVVSTHSSFLSFTLSLLPQQVRP